MGEKKVATSIRISSDGKNILETLAAHFGITQAGVMEMALRKLMQLEGLSLEGSRSEAKGDKPASG